MTPPIRPPTADDLLANPIVQQALAEAWRDSEVNDPLRRHEEGGWMYLDLATGRLTVLRAPTGLMDAIDLRFPPEVNGSVIVGKFHTHPNPTSEGWYGGPSIADQEVDAEHGVPDVIRADDGTYVSGPAIRRGGLSGKPGFPD
jgi:hypothetical protein